MIPRKVVGKFSIRIVPNQTPEIVEKVVVDYCNKVWKTRNSTNKVPSTKVKAIEKSNAIASKSNKE